MRKPFLLLVVLCLAATVAAAQTPIASDTMGYYVQRPDLSPATPSGPPPPYLSVTHFFLKPEGVLDFNDGVKKASAAMVKAMPNNPSNWYSLANGGPGPEVVLVRDLKSISELQGVPGKTVDQIVQEAYGDQGAAVMVAIRKAYHKSYSELLHFRPDLSYMPAAAKP